MKKLKYILIPIVAFVLSFQLQAQDQINWLKFEEAIAANEQNPKMILVDVYTDWCGWCKKMAAQKVISVTRVSAGWRSVMACNA